MAGGMHGREACMVGRNAWQGACMAGGCTWQVACVAGEMVTTTDGTHPTGMYSVELLVNKPLLNVIGD